MNFSMNIPVATTEYFLTVRLAVGGLSEKAGLDIDEAEDLKVCVTESMLILKRNGVKAVNLEFDDGDGLEITVKSIERGDAEECDSTDDEISYALLGALVDDVRLERRDDKTDVIVLSKRV